MADALWFLWGLLLGGGSVGWLLWKERNYLRAELTTAQDRLYAAWQGGASIPLREQIDPPPPVTIEALPDALLVEVLAFEDPVAQGETETFIRQRLTLGWSHDRILAHLHDTP